MEGRHKILIVDDEELAQDFLRFFLSKKYDVYTVGNVNAFYNIIHKVRFDLILMDVSLRDSKDGIQLTKEMKQSDQFRKIPIYILTALDTTKERNNALNAGADNFLVKPVDSNALVKLIDTNIRQGKIILN
jgi:DNA-binding response OmpR family regulator